MRNGWNNDKGLCVDVSFSRLSRRAKVLIRSKLSWGEDLKGGSRRDSGSAGGSQGAEFRRGSPIGTNPRLGLLIRSQTCLPHRFGPNRLAGAALADEPSDRLGPRNRSPTTLTPLPPPSTLSLSLFVMADSSSSQTASELKHRGKAFVQTPPLSPPRSPELKAGILVADRSSHPQALPSVATQCIDALLGPLNSRRGLP